MFFDQESFSLVVDSLVVYFVYTHDPGQKNAYLRFLEVFLTVKKYFYKNLIHSITIFTTKPAIPNI